DVLVKLAPRSLRAYDRLAQLHYRRGELDHAAALLASCQEFAPSDARPAIKRAVVEQQRGDRAARDAAIQRALDLSRGRERATIAFVGARLTLSAFGRQRASNAAVWIESSRPTTITSPQRQQGNDSVGLEDWTQPTNSDGASTVDWDQAKRLLRIAVQ